MLRSVKIYIIFLIVGIQSCSQVKFSTVTDWKINGPYEVKGNNSLYVDFLKESGGESSIKSKNTSEWETFKADSNGYFDLSKYPHVGGGKTNLLFVFKNKFR